MQIYWNKRKRLHEKRVQLPQDWSGTPTWPPFHCFGTPIWPPWRHVKTLYNNFGGLIMSGFYVTRAERWRARVCVCWLRGAQEARKPLLNRVWIRCFVANVASPFQLTIIWEPVNNFTVRFVIVEANHRFILHLRCMVIANLWRFQSCLSLYRLQLASCAMQSRGMAWYHRARCGVIW